MANLNMKTLDNSSLDKIIKQLKTEGYVTIGPLLSNGVIIYDEISGVKDLPEGINDRQEAGSYRTVKTDSRSLFGYTPGPQSWKKYLYPSKLKLWSAKRNGKGFDISHNGEEQKKYALIGVRPCELNSIQILDKVFNNGSYTDYQYNSIREKIFICAINCTRPGKTCFCVSMNTGPKAGKGFDLLLTEVSKGKEHYFTAEDGSAKGKKILSAVEGNDTTAEQKKAADEAVAAAAERMGRKLNTDNIKEILYKSHDHPVWEETGAKCLACTNCTLVCPTCFCSNVEDVTDLTGDNTERWRKWDSCFNLEYSRVAGGNFRTTVKARYRQWMTHKLASWQEQFGTFGCVGCGRCITWCPVGIDITKQAEKIRSTLRT
jgi:ferredoxin